jgi:Transglycosylase-like domain
MIQTILATALSAQLTYLTPSVTPTPSAHRIKLTRVLPENYVSPAVGKTDNTVQYKLENTDSIKLPELQEQIAHNDKLIKPTNEAQSSPAVFAIVPEVSPTPEPTAIPTVVMPVVTQATIIPITSDNGSISDAALDYLGQCEAGMNPTRNSGNGYYGAFQFSYGTWKSLNTGYERADLAPLSVQEAAVRQLLQRSSIYHQFPSCAYKMHAAGLI